MSGKSWFDWLLGGASAAAEITSTMVSNGNVLMTALNNLQNEETCFDKDFIAAFHHSCLARQTSIEGCVNKLKEKKYNDSLSDEEEKEFITQSALLSLLKGFDEIFEQKLKTLTIKEFIGMVGIKKIGEESSVGKVAEWYLQTGNIDRFIESIEESFFNHAEEPLLQLLTALEFPKSGLNYIFSKNTNAFESLDYVIQDKIHSIFERKTHTFGVLYNALIYNFMQGKDLSILLETLNQILPEIKAGKTIITTPNGSELKFTEDFFIFFEKNGAPLIKELIKIRAEQHLQPIIRALKNASIGKDEYFKDAVNVYIKKLSTLEGTTFQRLIKLRNEAQDENVELIESLLDEKVEPSINNIVKSAAINALKPAKTKHFGELSRLSLVGRLYGLAHIQNLFAALFPRENSSNFEAFREVGGFLLDVGRILKLVSLVTKEIVLDEEGNQFFETNTSLAVENNDPLSEISETKQPKKLFSTEFEKILKDLSEQNSEIKSSIDNFYANQRLISDFFHTNMTLVSKTVKHLFKPYENIGLIEPIVIIAKQKNSTSINASLFQKKIEEAKEFISIQKSTHEDIENKIKLHEKLVSQYFIDLISYLKFRIEKIKKLEINLSTISQTPLSSLLTEEHALVIAALTKTIQDTIQLQKKIVALYKIQKTNRDAHLLEIEHLEENLKCLTANSDFTEINQQLDAVRLKANQSSITKSNGVGFYQKTTIDFLTELLNKAKEFSSDESAKFLLSDNDYTDELILLTNQLRNVINWEDTVVGFNYTLTGSSTQELSSVTGNLIRYLVFVGKHRGIEFSINALLDVSQSYAESYFLTLERETVNSMFDDWRVLAPNNKQPSTSLLTIQSQQYISNVSEYHSLQSQFNELLANDPTTNSIATPTIHAIQKLEMYFIDRGEKTGNKIGYSTRDYLDRRKSFGRILKKISDLPEPTGNYESLVKFKKDCNRIIQKERDNFKRWKPLNSTKEPKEKFKIFIRNILNLFKLSANYSKGLRELQKAINNIDVKPPEPIELQSFSEERSTPTPGTDPINYPVLSNTRTPAVKPTMFFNFLREQTKHLSEFHNPATNKGLFLVDEDMRIETVIDEESGTIVHKIQEPDFKQDKIAQYIRASTWLQLWNLPTINQAKAIEKQQFNYDANHEKIIKPKK